MRMRGTISLCLKMDLKRLQLDKGLQTNTPVLQKSSLAEKKKRLKRKHVPSDGLDVGGLLLGLKGETGGS